MESCLVPTAISSEQRHLSHSGFAQHRFEDVPELPGGVVQQSKLFSQVEAFAQ
jgi:hypothetical protein